MEKTEVIDIQMAENGAIFIEYDDKGGQYYSVAEDDNQFKTLGEIIFDRLLAYAKRRIDGTYDDIYV